ncbi:MAG: hypothetical protein DI523_36965, partial [Paraburkholderia fungorum]
ACGVKPLSLLTFFAAAKKVSAAPHRGNANRPLTQQGKAKRPTTTQENPTTKGKTDKPTAAQAKKNQNLKQQPPSATPEQPSGPPPLTP